MQFNISPGTSHRGTAPEAQATGEQRKPLGLRHCRTQCGGTVQTGTDPEAHTASKPAICIPRVSSKLNFAKKQATVNDPSAGSPTETLLRHLLPLNDKVWTASRGIATGEPAASPQSGGLTGSFNR